MKYELKTYKDIESGNYPKNESELLEWFMAVYSKPGISKIKKLYEDTYDVSLDLDHGTVKTPSWW